MKQEVKCHSCGKTMFVLNLLPDGKHWALAPKQKFITEQKEGEKYIICPYCGADHATNSFLDEGLSQTQITGLKE